MDVEEWLDRMGLARYAGAFEENAIDRDVLSELTDADLRELGVSVMGHRKRILKAIVALDETVPVAAQRPDAAPNPSPGSAPSPGPERRHLTVMFCDLVGSTQLAERFDPEDLSDIVRSYQHAGVAVIEQFEGHVARYMGDGLLVYFGYPRAHEDDAARALEAARGIIDAVTRLEPRAGLVLEVRIGIATGPVVVGESIGTGEAREQVVLGETPNLAARLQSLAKPQTVLIADTTRRLAGERFECADLGKHELKGVSEAVRAWRVDAVREQVPVARTRVDVGEMVAREHELAMLEERWQQARDRAGQVVVITGEPGIGKSLLIDAMRTRAASGDAAQIVFRCSAHHANNVLHPVRAHLARLLGFTDRDDDEARWTKLNSGLQRYAFATDDTVALFAGLLSVPLPVGRAPLALSPQQERIQTRAALLAWLAEDAEQSPLLQIWEDLHWADPSSLDLIGAIIEHAPGLRMLTLLTARLEFEAPWRPRSHLSQIALTRVGPHHVEAIVARIAQGKRLPPEVVAEIQTRADGVPLFVEEMTKAIIESDALAEGRDAFALVGPIDSVHIPLSLHESLAARLDRLGTSKATAQVAAVIGRQVEFELLRAVAPADESTLRQHLDQIVNAELLYPRGVPPGALYVFKHALIQDAAYSSLLRKTRQGLHEAIASAIGAAGRAQPNAALLAYHLALGSEPYRAIPHALEAGAQAMRLHARAEATNHFVQALELARAAEESDEILGLTIDATLGLASVASSREDLERDRTNLASAQALADTLGDPARLSRVAYWRGRIAYISGDVTDALDYAGHSLAVADEIGDEKLAAPPVNLLGRAALLRGDIVRGAELMVRNAAQMRAIGDVTEESTACAFAAFYLAFQGRFDESVDYEARSLELVETLDNPFARASVLFMQAINMHHRGRWHDAFSGHQESRRIAEGIGDQFRIYTSCMWESLAHIDAGDVPAASPLCERAVALREHLGTDFQQDVLLSAQSTCRLAAGDEDDARHLSEEAIERARRSDSQIGLGLALRSHALILMRCDLDAARASMRETIDRFERISAQPYVARAHRAFADGLSAQGHTAEASQELEAAMSGFTRLGLVAEWDSDS